MSLHVITGKASSGKTARAYGLIETAIADGRDAWLLLPSQPDVELAKREFAMRIPIGIRVGTFSSLVAETWGRFGDGRAIVTPAQRSLLLTKCARTIGAKLSLARLASPCVERITDAAGEGWRSSDVHHAGHGSDLLKLLCRYAGELSARDLIESSEALHHLATEARAPAPSLVAHRFTDFSTAQRAYLKRASTVAEVYVTMLWEQGFPPTRSVDELVDGLCAGVTVSLAASVDGTDPALACLAEGLYGEAPAGRVGSALRVVLAEGGEAEGRLIADEVLLALSDGSAARPEDVAVVFRNPNTHLSHLKHAFQIAGIPADFDVRQTLGEIPLGAAILHLVEFALCGRRECILRLLRGPFGGALSAEARELERRWRRNGEVEPRQLLSDLRRAFPDLAGAVADALSCLQGAVGPAECERLADAFRTLFRLRYGAGDITAQGPEAESDSRALTHAVRMLSATAELDTDELSLADLHEGLSRIEFGASAAQRPGHVQVTSMLRARGQSYSAVIVGGLNADEFPARNDEGFTPSGAIGRILSAFGAAAPGDEADSAEQLLFYEVITGARRRLVWCAQSADSDGQAIAISPILEMALDGMRGKDECGIEEIADRVVSLSAPPDASAAGREAVLAAALAGERDERVDAAVRRARGRTGALGLSKVSAAGLLRDSVSASEIEAYVQCPYRWFLNYLIRPRELESDFGARDEGDIAHRLLALVYQSMIDADALPISASTLANAKRHLSSAVAKCQAEQPAPDSLMGLVGWSRAESWARRILDEDAHAVSRFKPSKVEWSFGLGQDQHGVDFGDFVLNGRIDRIDVDADGNVLVIDYKRTLADSMRATRLLTDGHLQGLLYLASACRVLDLRPAGALYRSLSKAGTSRGMVRGDIDVGHKLVKTDLCDRTELESALDAAVGLASRAVKGMRAGSIEPKPLSEAVCRYCPEAFRCRCSQ